MSKFTVAGVSTQFGVTKVRFANDIVTRIKILSKGTHTSLVELIELPKAMSKLEALQYLQEQGITSGDAGFAVANKLAEKSKVAKKGEIMVKATKATVSTKSVDAKVTA